MPRYIYIPRGNRRKQAKRNRDLDNWEYDTMGVTEELFYKLLDLIRQYIMFKMKRWNTKIMEKKRRWKMEKKMKKRRTGRKQHV